MVPKEMYFWRKAQTFLGLLHKFTLSKYQTKQTFTLGKLCRIVLHPTEILRTKTKMIEIPHDFFPDHPWKSHFLFRLTLGISTFFFNTHGNSMSMSIILQCRDSPILLLLVYTSVFIILLVIVIVLLYFQLSVIIFSLLLLLLLTILLLL